ncbi:hypothetical protein FG379_001305 [Cryptosporidium bovis]|uniref:uncharacterized protein n=1 Tax=Cryptosporidium bovis TaxID=310047 RepID=UPI00351A4A1F|nr:hypothetical protein FG379_001305 [Cryptosporidium bovis]
MVNDHKNDEINDSDCLVFPSEYVEYIMNKQGAKSNDKDVFKVVSLAGQKYIEECLKKSIETSNGKFVIKSDNLRNFIRMENSNSTIVNDFNLFLMSNRRYKECENSK